MEKSCWILFHKPCQMHYRAYNVWYTKIFSVMRRWWNRNIRKAALTSVFWRHHIFSYPFKARAGNISTIDSQATSVTKTASQFKTSNYTPFMACNILSESTPHPAFLHQNCRHFIKPMYCRAHSHTKCPIAFYSTSSYGLGGSNSCLDTGSSGTNDIHGKDIFASQIQSCSTPEDILSFTAAAINDRSLCMQHLTMVFSCLQTTVYNQLSFAWLLSDHKHRKQQLFTNFLGYQLMDCYLSDSRFQQLTSFAEAQLNCLTEKDCVNILHSLEYLYQKQSTLFKGLLSKCTDHIEQFNLHDLAILSSCLQANPKDFTTLGKIANAVKYLLTSQDIGVDLNLGDLCDIFANIRHVVSKDLLELAAQSLLSQLRQESPTFSLDSLSKVCSFAEISGYECTESLVNGILRIPQKSFDGVHIDNLSLTFDVCSAIGKSPYLCSVIHRVRSQCRSELQSADSLPIQDIVRLSLPLDQMPECVSLQIYAECVENSDNFLLFQMMSHHLLVDLAEWPGYLKLLYAYRNRLEKLLTDCSQNELEELLGQNDGEWAVTLFNFLNKISSMKVRLNANAAQRYNNLLQLHTLSWDASPTNVYLAAMQSLKNLKSNMFLTPDDSPSHSKLLVRLHFDDLMCLYNVLDDLLLKHPVSASATQQATSLKHLLKQLFQDRLSRKTVLTPALTTNKIWQRWRKRKSSSNGLFGHLIDSLPRFTAERDQINCLRALRILYWSSEKIPLEQEETYENLISFLTSESELHVYPWIQLVKILAYAGYQSKDMAAFEEWTVRLTQEILEHNYVYKSMQVQLAHYLSMMGIFHDSLLLKIFSLDYIISLEEEFKETAPHKTLYVKNSLALLSRSVSVQCPHLTVPWIAGGYLPERPRNDPTKRLIKSVGRVCGDQIFVHASACSPYLHHIDALVFLDKNMMPVKLENTSMENIDHTCHEKIAVLHLNRDHFCHDSDKLIGECQTHIRELQMLGYTVVTFSYKELSAPDFLDGPCMDMFVRQKMNAAVGLEVFPDLSEFSAIYD